MMIATPLGMAVGGVLIVGLSIVLPKLTTLSVQDFLVSGIFGFGIGAIIGIAQWGFLQEVFHHAWIWITAVIAGRAIGWTIGWNINSALDLSSLSVPLLPAGIGGALGGAIYGLITGLCLIWLAANYKQRDLSLRRKTDR